MQITTQFWLWFGIFLHLWLRQILNRFAYCHSQLCDMRLSESPMSETLRPRVKYVIGPDGSPLTIADLPPPSTSPLGHSPQGGGGRRGSRRPLVS